MDVSLRPVCEFDLPLLLAWAHIDKIWEFMPSSRKGEVLTWERHLEWWRNRRDRMDYIIEFESRPVGVLHLISHSNYPHLEPHWQEIGLYIGEIGLWGKGVGTGAVNQAVDLMRKGNAMMQDRHQRKGADYLRAVIHPDNARSIALFTKAGFKKVGPGRSGQDRYELSLENLVANPT